MVHRMSVDEIRSKQAIGNIKRLMCRWSNGASSIKKTINCNVKYEVQKQHL
jgi:hypothetical protein